MICSSHGELDVITKVAQKVGKVSLTPFKLFHVVNLSLTLFIFYFDPVGLILPPPPPPWPVGHQHTSFSSSSLPTVLLRMLRRPQAAGRTNHVSSKAIRGIRISATALGIHCFHND